MNYDKFFMAGLDKKIGVGKFFEDIIQIIYTDILVEGDTAIDCGVNRCQHTFNLAELVGFQGLVLGFEALPSLHESIKKGISARGLSQIKLITKAVAEHDGFTSFTYVKDGDGYSGIKERLNIPTNLTTSIITLENIPMTSIDSVLVDFTPRNHVKFIKLDLEGGEFNALKGGFKVLRNERPILVFENGRTTSAKVYNYSKEEWFNFFSTINYKIFDLFGRPFVHQDWACPNLPWYFIGVPAELCSESYWLLNTLPFKIQNLYSKLFY